MGADPSSPQVVWDSLTDVERTCLGVSFMRWRGTQTHSWPDGRPWYTSPYDQLLVEHCIPTAQQQKIAGWSRYQRGRIYDFVPVRTAELDSLIAGALDSHEEHQRPIRQLVLLGAGMDTRAWRLHWPPGFRVFEVDSAAVLAFKSRVLSTAAAARQQQQQQQQQQLDTMQTVQPELRCQSRTEVAADAGQADELWSRLVSSGLDAAKPILWLLEGFIGYLTPEAGDVLLALLAHNSPPGSRIIMTAPPAPDMVAEAGASFLVSKLLPWAPWVVRQAAERVFKQLVLLALQLGLVKEGQWGPKLHHQTKEQPTNTLRRLSAAGWQQCQLLTAQQLATKYGVETAQPILLGTIA